MTLPKSHNPALILIDLQKGFENIAYWGGGRNNLNAELQASELLKHWRAKNLPIYHIKHCSSILTSPLHESNPGNEFIDLFLPVDNEKIIRKNVNSAFIGTDLQSQLDRAGIMSVVIAGLTTDHCVSTSTRMAANLGYKVFLVADATATFDKKGVNGQHYPAELIHETALASLNHEFAEIVTTDFIKKSI